MVLALIKRFTKSISLVTFLIAIAFGICAILLITFNDGSLTDYPGISITDTDHIKFILSFTIGGLFTLTVFTYTMVMNVLNRSISNYSPRLIPLILHERHHQIILGTTSGTIIYCLILAIFVSSEANENFPPMAGGLAIVFGIFCVLLFIYFIHAVSQSIHVNYILRKSFNNTKRVIRNLMEMEEMLQMDVSSANEWPYSLSFGECGYLNAIRLDQLLKISASNDIVFSLIKPMGSFILEGEPILKMSRKPDAKLNDKIKRCLAVDREEPIDVLEIGFKHLVEVAVKAASPAINDPGTSLIAIDYLTQLFILRHRIPVFNKVTSKKGGALYFELVEMPKLMDYVFREMETYMNDDPILTERLNNAKQTVSKLKM